MAINLGNALVYLGTEAAGLKKDLDKAEGQVASWTGRVGDSAKKLLTGALAGGVAVVTGAVIAAGAAAFDTANQLQVATGRLQDQLGISQEQAETLRGVVQDVYGNNFGESVEDVANSVAAVNQNLGDIPVDQIETATERALALRDAFEIEVGESTAAARSLMDNFGLSAGEAFAFIQNGLQQGLNRSGDFLDTINEYSVQFQSAGADAGQFFSVLQTGLQGGPLGTDKAADLLKEFRIRLQDGSDSTADALEQLGIRSEFLLAGLADGSITTADAFGLVQAAMRRVDDEGQRMRIGVMLMGTQYEDLGQEAVAAINMTAVSTEAATTATGELANQYNNLGSFVEGMKRRVQVGLVPLGDALLGIANDALPLVNRAFQWFETNVIPALTNAAEVAADFVGAFIGRIDEGVPPLQALKDTIAEFVPPAQAEAIIGFIEKLEERAPFALGAVTSLRDMLLALSEGDYSAVATNFQGAAEQLAAALGIPVGAAELLLGLIGFRLVGAIAGFLVKVTGIGTIVSGASTVLGGLGVTAGGLLAALANLTGVVAVVGLGFLAATGIIKAGGYTWETWLGMVKGIWDNMIKIMVEISHLIGEQGFPGLMKALGVVVAEGGLAILEMTGIKDALLGAGEAVLNFLDGLVRLWDFLVGKKFEVDLEIPGIPDILTPGSPTPFEMGLRGIDDALGAVAQKMNNLNSAAGQFPELAGIPGLADIPLGFDRQRRAAGEAPPPPGQNPAAVGGVSIENLTINVGTGDPGTVKQAVEDGITNAMRGRGDV